MTAKRQYSQRKPTLLSVAKQVQKAGIEVARYEVEPSGKIIIITSKGESAGVEPNLWDAEIAKLRAATPKGGATMTKLQLRYVQSFGEYHYFRRRGWPRIPLPGVVGSTEFMEAYQQALAAAPVAIGASKRSKPGSVSAAIAEYYGSQAFRSLTGGTPASRRAVLEKFRDRHGDKPLASMPKQFVVALIDTMTPHEAKNWLVAFKHVVRWALERKLMRNDPTLSVQVRRPKSDGFATWTEDEIAQFEARWPIGSKPRLALALGLYTAQRRGDVVRIGRQHIRDGVLAVLQQKTGVTLAIPVHPD